MQSSAAVLCTRFPMYFDYVDTRPQMQYAAVLVLLALCRFINYSTPCATCISARARRRPASQRRWLRRACGCAHCCVAAVFVPVACDGFNPSTAYALSFPARAQQRLTCLRHGRLNRPLV
jgi:hypothetical protein